MCADRPRRVMQPSAWLRRGVVASAACAALIVVTALPSGASARTVPPKQWFGSVCTAIRHWDTATTKLPTVDPTNVASAKSGLTAYFKRSTKATGTLLSKVTAAGVPRGAGGKALSTSLLRAIRDLRAANSDARVKAAALPTGDPGAFVLSVGTISQGLAAAQGKFATEVDAAGSGDRPAFAKAFAATKACTALG